MNRTVGKFSGMALLMAAALLAAMFAAGVFSPGVGAHDGGDNVHGGSNAGTATLDKLVVTVGEAAANLPASVTTPSTPSTSNSLEVPSSATHVTYYYSWTEGSRVDVTYPLDGFFTRADNWYTGAQDLINNTKVFKYESTSNWARTEIETSKVLATRTADGDVWDGDADHNDIIAVEFKLKANRFLPRHISIDATDKDRVPSSGTPPAEHTLKDTNYRVYLPSPGRMLPAKDDYLPGLDLGLYYINAVDDREAGSAQKLTLKARVAASDRDEITIDFKEFGVPSSIDPDDVTIVKDANTSSTKEASPGDVEVDGTTVTLTFRTKAATQDDSSSGIESALAADSTTDIIFSRRAGITLPKHAGLYPVSVMSEDTAAKDAAFSNFAEVVRSVKADPMNGIRGTETTLTGKGFNDDETITVMVGDNSLGTAVAEDGMFTMKVMADAKDGSGNNIFAAGANTIKAKESDGEATVMFTIDPSFTISPESPAPGEQITVTLKDVAAAPNGSSVSTMAMFGSVSADASIADKQAASFKVTVPSTLEPGRYPLKVTVGSQVMRKTLTIGAKTLTLSPSTAVAGQEVTVQGSGFTSSGTGDTELKVGGNDAEGVDSLTSISVDSGGRISVTFTVPEEAKTGERTVQFKDKSGRVGRATLTIPKAMLTVTPTESGIGSSITVSGTGFPANDLVQISYAVGPGSTARTRPLGNASTNAGGGFSAAMTVPTFAQTGETHRVKATSQLAENDANQVSAEAEHSTPQETISFSPAMVTSGGRVTVSGQNFAGFLAVDEIMIGTTDVRPVPVPTTNADGSFSATGILVPKLDPGRYTVKVKVGSDTVTKFLEVVKEAPPTAPEDVFGSLGDRLVRVWYLDAVTQTWSFYDPDPEFMEFNTLKEVKSGYIVAIIISAGEPVEFNGKMLQPGTNYYAIN